MHVPNTFFVLLLMILVSNVNCRPMTSESPQETPNFILDSSSHKCHTTECIWQRLIRLGLVRPTTRTTTTTTQKPELRPIVNQPKALPQNRLRNFMVFSATGGEGSRSFPKSINANSSRQKLEESHGRPRMPNRGRGRGNSKFDPDCWGDARTDPRTDCIWSEEPLEAVPPAGEGKSRRAT